MKICHLYISPGHNYFGHHGQIPGAHPIVEVAEIECIAGCGVKGDRFFNYKENYQGQITFFSREVFDSMCAVLKLCEMSPGSARRNVVTEGADLNSLIGAEFEIQGVRFRGMAHCKPCYWMDHAFAPGAEQFLQNCGGLRSQILTGGRLCVDCFDDSRITHPGHEPLLRISGHPSALTNSRVNRSPSLFAEHIQQSENYSPSPSGRGPG